MQALTRGEAVISVIIDGELRYGAEKRQDPERALGLVAELLTLLPAQPLPADPGEVYGRIRADLERRGIMIGNNDLWIAAHGQSAGLIVVTNNDREFRRVPNLLVENWAEPIR